MFTVGGFGGIGSTGQRMKDLLGAGDGSAGDKWFSKANEIIPFNHKEFDIPTPSVSKLNSDGKYNPAYLGYVAKQGFGKFLENFKRGRSEAAVDLAASLYAHASKYPKAAINVLGHGVGGNVVREATEILNRMRSPDGKSPAGPSILQRMNIVNLGTPFFGFTNDKFWNNIRNRTITSNQDPFSILPKKAAQWISSVTGHEVDDYLKTNEVRERLREAFGYYSTSLVGGAREEKQRKETFGAIEEALNTAGFGPAAKLWGALGRVVDLSKENPAAASIIGGSILLGTSKLTYSHMQSQYQKNLGTGAKEAQQIAANYNTPNIQKPSAMFVVGGSGAPSASLIEQLQQGADSDPNRKWLLQKNALVGVDPAGLPQMNKGSLSAGGPASLGALAQTVYGSTLGRVLKTGKNNDAIALAAQLHAYGTKDHKPPGKTPARKLNINVLAGSNGGQVAREAVDILKRMEGGADVAKRVQLVTLGTPHFGLASDQMREVNLMGDGDPFEKLPFQRGGGMTQRVNGVGSHDPASYLGNKGVVGKIADAFKGNEPKKAAKSEEMAGISPKLQPFVTSKTAKWRIEALQNSNPENPINRPNFTSLSLDEQRKEIEKYLRNWRLAQLGQAIKEEKDPPEKPPTRSRRKSTKPPES
jgi:hypothetical protein